ncbi:MAG: PRC-barrel domain-containing protein [Dehalococcoidia bacterium]
MTTSSSFGGTTPRLGERVYTADGDELGTVKDVAGACFKVDATMQPDYWLATDCIASSAGDGIRLNFRKERLGDMKLDGPDNEHKGVHRHTTTL